MKTTCDNYELALLIISNRSEVDVHAEEIGS